MALWHDGPWLVRSPHKKKRILSPFVKCHASGRRLFIQKAVIVYQEVAYEVVSMRIYSEKEHMIATLKGEFDEHQI